MKILFWCDAFWPDIGGLEVFCVNLIRELRRRGHQCAVITNRGGIAMAGTADFEGVPVHGFEFFDSLHRANLKEIVQLNDACSRLVDAFAPDMIHLHGVARSIFHFTRQQKRRRLPAVITLHDNLLRGAHTMAGPVLENVERIVAISGYIQRDSLALDASLEPRLRTILNALPPAATKPTALPQAPRVLALGRLTEHKGFDLAIRAIAAIRAEFPQATLTVAGDGPDRAKLEALAAELAAPVRFAGWVAPDSVPSLINDHAVMVIPSRWQEPFGLVALQAAQMARPAIVARSGGLPEVVVDGETGLVVANEDVAGFAAALRKLLADPALAARLGEAGRARALEKFRFDRMVDAYEQIYAEALGKS